MPSSQGDKQATERSSLWLNVDAVAALLGVSRSTIWRWLDKKLVPQPRHIGGRTLWARTDLELFTSCRSMAEYRRRKRLDQK